MKITSEFTKLLTEFDNAVYKSGLNRYSKELRTETNCKAQDAKKALIHYIETH